MAKEEALGPHQFALSILPGGYGIHAGATPLATPAGRAIFTPNGALVRLLLDELGSWPCWYLDSGVITRPRPLGAYTLLSWQLDAFETQECNDKEIGRMALEDPVLHPQAGPEQLEQRFAWAPIDEMLREAGGRVGYAPGFDEPTRTAIEGFTRFTWNGFSPAQRAVADTLRQVHGSLLAAVALVLGRMSADWFAHAVLATSPLHGVFGFPVASEESADVVHAREYSFLRDQARTALAFLAAAHPRQADVERLVERGESERVEFKATALGFPGARTRERLQAKAKIARTVAAMMSGDGGHIVVGVTDEGKVVGLPEMSEASPDQVQLALADFLMAHLGVDAASQVSMAVLTLSVGRVLVLTCPAAGKRVALDDGGTGRRFFVRQGPRTVESRPGQT